MLNKITVNLQKIPNSESIEMVNDICDVEKVILNDGCLELNSTPMRKIPHMMNHIFVHRPKRFIILIYFKLPFHFISYWEAPTSFARGYIETYNTSGKRRRNPSCVLYGIKVF